MHKIYLVFYSLLILSLTACSLEKEKNAGSGEESDNSRIKKFGYEVLSDKETPGLKITNVNFDTLALHKDTKGLLVSFNVIASSKAFDSISKLGFNSLFIDLTGKSDESKTYSHRNEVFKASDKKKFMHTHKECFISSATDRNLEISFPYRLLEMSEGDHELTVNIEVFPAKFEDDTSALLVKMLNSISPAPMTSLSMKLKVKAPKLYKASFTVHQFKLNTKVVKAEKFDFAVGGSGLPDLFWEVYCGNDYIYYSPVIKNKITYNKSYSSPEFYCTKEDILNLAVVDYDNGPFNTQDDIIEKYTKKLAAIPANRIDTLKYGNLEYLVMETKVE